MVEGVKLVEGGLELGAFLGRVGGVPAPTPSVAGFLLSLLPTHHEMSSFPFCLRTSCPWTEPSETRINLLGCECQILHPSNRKYTDAES